MAIGMSHISVWAGWSLRRASERLTVAGKTVYANFAYLLGKNGWKRRNEVWKERIPGYGHGDAVWD